MSVHFYWYVPTNGDGEYLGLKTPERPPTLDYIVQIAQTAETAGFEGILIPTGIPYLDSWMVGSAIIHHTKKIKPLIAFRPGFIAPTVAAKMAATLHHFANGRVLVNVVTGGSAKELGQDGDFLEHDQRYHRTSEFLHVVKNAWTQPSFNHQGHYFTIKDGTLRPSISKNPNIPIYFGGSSEIAKEVAAQSADVYLQWGEPVAHAKQQIEDVKQRAQKYGRTLEYGIRLHIVIRDHEQEAWDAAYKIISKVDSTVQHNIDHYYETTDSVAQKRMNELSKRNDRFDKYGWTGIGKIRKGAGTALVGTPEQVREGLQEYIRAGVTHFILSGFPHLEEAERLGRSLLPLFKETVLS
ncbi:LLM class flavin-dependent oxidoreductase [Anoxybacteroides rupiense]|uniref:LLM class flavin-dependent oxidoreductase n=1 Tax=Anoxybacteroides rupiense TaxID=311460 RepID=UPI0016069976|nr:LLM class flavin-dependent oxidoreductase [Anoxybacillus rupiensis]MBB3908131.1 alkanesulfonate monooxygenase [Anoxybacillus rupiensis]